MFIPQAELFQGLSAEARAIVERQKVKQSYKEGDFVFEEGEDAQYWYILESGRIDLLLGKKEEMRFLVHYPGEIFGWSSLVEPHRYLASARCMTQSKAWMVPREAINDIAKDHPLDALLVYKNLAGVVGNRLIASYRDREAEPARPAYGG